MIPSFRLIDVIVSLVSPISCPLSDSILVAGDIFSAPTAPMRTCILSIFCESNALCFSVQRYMLSSTVLTSWYIEVPFSKAHSSVYRLSLFLVSRCCISITPGSFRVCVERQPNLDLSKSGIATVFPAQSIFVFVCPVSGDMLYECMNVAIGLTDTIVLFDGY